jgi:hypothetical protein
MKFSSKIHFILGCRPSANNTKIEITTCILLDHDRMQLEINSKRKYSNTRRLNDQWVTEEIKRESFKLLESYENGNATWRQSDNLTV